MRMPFQSGGLHVQMVRLTFGKVVVDNRASSRQQYRRRQEQA